MFERDARSRGCGELGVPGAAWCRGCPPAAEPPGERCAAFVSIEMSPTRARACVRGLGRLRGGGDRISQLCIAPSMHCPLHGQGTHQGHRFAPVPSLLCPGHKRYPMTFPVVQPLLLFPSTGRWRPHDSLPHACGVILGRSGASSGAEGRAQPKHGREPRAARGSREQPAPNPAKPS